MVHVNTVAKVYSFFRHLKTNGLGFRPVCLSDKLLCYAFFDFFFIVKDNYACSYLDSVHTWRIF